MKLLVEEVDYNSCELKIEENAQSGGKRTYKISGPFMQAECVNRNGRIYTKSLLMREANRYRDTYIKQNRAFGECDHPATPNVSLSRASHIITDLVEHGNDFIGTARLMDTPSGIVAQRILDAGGRLGVSSRGVGTVANKNGKLYVNEDYRLITPADLVADPSAHQAFVDAVYEGAEWVYQEGLGWVEMWADGAKKAIDHSQRGHERLEEMAEAFSDFMNRLSRAYIRD